MTPESKARTKDHEAIWRMLKARRLAVVGASQDPRKLSGVLVPSIQAGGFTGELFPVNPKADTVAGLKSYPSVSAIPGSLDLVIIAVPARFVPGILHEAADKGAAGAIVISAGGRESGRPEFDREIVEIARARGLRLFGPNIQGVAYGPNRLSAVFWPVITEHGPLAVVGQSGTVVAAMSDWAQDDGLGVSASISLGNQADICESDVVRLLADDEQTKAVALYLEGVDDGPRFVAAIKDVAMRKPLVVLKCGRSQRGRAAVASHTGSLAGSDRVFGGVCRQFGVVRADDSEGLYDAAKILACMPLPAGRRVLVISSSGGSCALAADAAEECGLVLPDLPDDFVAALRDLGLAEWGSLANPLDLAAPFVEQFRAAIELADKADLADVILPVFGDPIEGAAELMAELSPRSRARMCAAYYGGGAVEQVERRLMQRAGVPVFPSPERAMKALGAICWYAEQRQRSEAELALSGQVASSQVASSETVS
jgi:acyl-CoA synthetase (NDP forming)